MNNFSDIAGHELIKKSLKESMSTGKVSHAYIFSGKKGSGKKMMANAFAKALQCEEGCGKACGKCRSCTSFDSLNNPDVYYVLPAKTKNPLERAILPTSTVVTKKSTKSRKYRKIDASSLFTDCSISMICNFGFLTFFI